MELAVLETKKFKGLRPKSGDDKHGISPDIPPRRLWKIWINLKIKNDLFICNKNPRRLVEDFKK
jgi:hypothetical protein